MDKFRLYFGGVVAYVLLGFYVYATYFAIRAVYCAGQHCAKCYPAVLTSGNVTALTAVGGLVSALVVAELAITPSGKLPVASLLGNAEPGGWMTGVIVAYMLAWLVIGVVSFVIGYMQHPDIVPALTASAKSWFGFALAAVYAYLQIKPASGG